MQRALIQVGGNDFGGDGVQRVGIDFYLLHIAGGNAAVLIRFNPKGSGSGKPGWAVRPIGGSISRRGAADGGLGGKIARLLLDCLFQKAHGLLPLLLPGAGQQHPKHHGQHHADQNHIDRHKFAAQLTDHGTASKR